MVSRRRETTPEHLTQSSDEELTVETSEPDERPNPSIRPTYDDCRAPWFSVALNVACFLLYGYALYFVNYTGE